MSAAQPALKASTPSTARPVTSANWSPEDVNWTQFDASRATPELISLAKAACLVEHNGYDYARYLCQVFKGDTQIEVLAKTWAEEEVQHGRVLRQWAELADPTFDFDHSFKAFTTGYKLPLNVDASVRGSRSGELVARCIVEIGTSSYYSAIRDYTDEPVLKEICARIAADEVRHYKMFHVLAQGYQDQEKIGFWSRLRVALGRIAESEDDELAYAFYAAHLTANDNATPYVHELYKNRYLMLAYSMYRRVHIERMTAMLFKVLGLKPRSWLNRLADHIAWHTMQSKLRRVQGLLQAA